MGQDELLRMTIFIVVLSIIALWEVAAPRRRLTTPKGRRWFVNLSMIVIASLLVRLSIPLLPLGLAIMAAEKGWGLFHILPMPQWLSIILAVIALDLVIYLQHVLFHFLPILWRLHRMHHSDLDLDASSANRFHPFEIIISIIIKLGAILMLGASPLAVLLFEIFLNASATFNHGNIRIPLTLDRWLRFFLVTPDMHRVHHSVIPRETNSNFGFCLPWWDFLGGTYREQPSAGHQNMTIGLNQFRNPDHLTLTRLLIQPFVRKP